MSSPVFATTTSSSAPTTSSIPRASFAPPVPPARTTTGALTRAIPCVPGATPAGGSRQAVAQPCEPDPRSDLIADVDRDDQRGQLLDDPRHLERPAVDGAQAIDPPDQLREPALVVLAVTADQHV